MKHTLAWWVPHGTSSSRLLGGQVAERLLTDWHYYICSGMPPFMYRQQLAMAKSCASLKPTACQGLEKRERQTPLLLPSGLLTCLLNLWQLGCTACITTGGMEAPQRLGPWVERQCMQVGKAATPSQHVWLTITRSIASANKH
jgi:hypothetical protein